jgi:hypothetical protein
MAPRRAVVASKQREGVDTTAEAYRALEAKQTTEEQFRRALRKTARDYGFTFQYHTRFSVGSDPGFPDEVFLRDEGGGLVRCVAVECKRVGKMATDRQAVWLRMLGGVPGIESYCWTPEDWNVIHEVLGRGFMTEVPQ